ncbi:DNA methylase [Cellulophaga phage phi12:1]|uniref:DNA methylase n=2 Tax=Cellulophaga phage phi12:1 TaxID=1327976 RepID=S0A0D1_9CAUD|nr:DNA methyltransferase [Cellulophaga phage phi12:1]AGO47967.1 DNA methylase [Cellulophaga phage phi12:1]AGO48132.1 DNA methylase [Cellulophaga phage phi12:3]
MSKIKKVVSFFDGMSCGQIALNKVGIIPDQYLSYEIDKYAMIVAQANYPNTKQMGSVTEADPEDLIDVDLFIGGSPCQGFSFAGKQLNFEDPRSKLFFEFVKAWEIIKKNNPNAKFLLENVRMKKASEKVISDALGVEPIEIVSDKFVPQKRCRLYWTNIPNIEQPKQVDYDVNDFFDGNGFPSSCDVKRNFKRKSIFNTLTATYYKGIRASSRPAVSIKEGFLDDDRDSHRMLTPNECEALQAVPKNYTNKVSKTQRYKMLGNGWTVDVIAHIFKNL